MWTGKPPSRWGTYRGQLPTRTCQVASPPGIRRRGRPNETERPRLPRAGGQPINHHVARHSATGCLKAIGKSGCLPPTPNASSHQRPAEHQEKTTTRCRTISLTHRRPAHPWPRSSGYRRPRQGRLRRRTRPRFRAALDPADGNPVNPQPSGAGRTLDCAQNRPGASRPPSFRPSLTPGLMQVSA